MTVKSSPTYSSSMEFNPVTLKTCKQFSKDLTKFNPINRTGVVRIAAKKIHFTVYTKPDFSCRKMEIGYGDLPNSEQASSIVKRLLINTGLARPVLRIVGVLFFGDSSQVVCSRPFGFFFKKKKLSNWNKTNPNVTPSASYPQPRPPCRPSPFQSPPFIVPAALPGYRATLPVHADSNSTPSSANFSSLHRQHSQTLWEGRRWER